jgi:hypothetical protein
MAELLIGMIDPLPVTDQLRMCFEAVLHLRAHRDDFDWSDPLEATLNSLRHIRRQDVFALMFAVHSDPPGGCDRSFSSASLS